MTGAERAFALLAVGLSDGRRRGARLWSGQRRAFCLDAGIVGVPYPAPAPGWTRRTLTCGIALQCAPSKDRLAEHAVQRLTARELRALTIAEGESALGWAMARWPGLIPELRRALPVLRVGDGDLDGPAILQRAHSLARSPGGLEVPALLGRLSPVAAPGRSLASAARRIYGRMPWTSPRSDAYRWYSVPVGGDGGVRDPNLPPPSRPEDEESGVLSGQRIGIPYPEWNLWRETFLPDHVAVLERRHPGGRAAPSPVPSELLRWFRTPTSRAMKGGLEDGADLDVDRYIAHHLARVTGRPQESRVFRDLVPASRDVATALLLDASSSLGAGAGRLFGLQLACADALSRAMTLAGERHAVFTFTGNTRHRVEVTCLKDFTDRRLVTPGGLGLKAGGYTRLGAPLRHLTGRLLEQPARRRLLVILGDGLVSDEGYEGRYAIADVAHAVQEAVDAGITPYYLGVGPARTELLPDLFGPRRHRRVHRVEDLPRALAHVHRELTAS